MSKALLKVKNLSVRFPIQRGLFRHVVGEVVAVDDVSFDIDEREIVGLVGESGSGKSTVARAVMKLIEPTSGLIQFAGLDVSTLSKKNIKNFRDQIQIVFQDPYSSLNPRRMVYESILEAFNGNLEDVKQILEDVGLQGDMLYRYPHELSGGQQQRVCVGRAIARRPKLLVCDEAVSSLDVSVRAQILNLLMDLKERYQLSYLFITHDLSVVRHIADRLIIMDKGKIVEEGTTEEIFHNPKNSYTKKLLDSVPHLMC